MFYRLIMIGIFYIAFGHVSVYAACPGTPLTGAELSTKFAGATVSFDAAAPVGWMIDTSPDWHEVHIDGGSGFGGGLEEKGNPPLQPQKPVGSWWITMETVSEPAQICYQYDGDSTYCYNVNMVNACEYEFCTVIGSSLKATGTIDGCTPP